MLLLLDPEAKNIAFFYSWVHGYHASSRARFKEALSVCAPISTNVPCPRLLAGNASSASFVMQSPYYRHRRIIFCFWTDSRGTSDSLVSISLALLSTP